MTTLALMRLRNSSLKIFLTAFLGIALGTGKCCFASDTLRVMSYNVLYFGNECQGPTPEYMGYLKTITQFAAPDLLGLVKVASIKTDKSDQAGTAPLGFADSILKYGLPDGVHYAYCPFTNVSKANNNTLLFYNTKKLGCVGLVSCYSNITDFDTWKLYYKSPEPTSMKDTIFLYVTLCHDKSGKENENVRKLQIEGTLTDLKRHFRGFPNYIMMGDFNVRNSDEPLYQLLVNGEQRFKLYDPPFFPDQSLSYPANWEKEPKYTSYFTTSTRENESAFHGCGSGGGGKDWYDHIFMSKALTNNAGGIKYIPKSYKTPGNDGQRFKVSINNSNINKNTSAPENVIEALYRFSNKYPITASFEVDNGAPKSAVTGLEISNVSSFKSSPKCNIEIAYEEKKGASFTLHFAKDLIGQEVTILWSDSNGKQVFSKKVKIASTEFDYHLKIATGKYSVIVKGKHNEIFREEVTAGGVK